MAKSERQRQARLARKKQKRGAKAKGGGRPLRRVLNPMVLSDARSLPIREVRVNADWRETGGATLVVAREQFNQRSVLVLGVYEVDLGARGVREAYAQVDVPLQEYTRDVLPRLFGDEPTEAITPDLATAIVYRTLARAQEVGFAPAPEFGVARLVLPAPDKADPDAEVPWGRDGHPLLRVGEGEDGAKLRAVLDAKVGADGYDVEEEGGEAGAAQAQD